MLETSAPPRRSGPTDLLPRCREHLQRLGDDFAEGVLPGVESEVLATLSALDTVSGTKPLPEDVELASFLFAIGRIAAAEAGLPGPDARVLLHTIASWLFHRREGTYGITSAVFSTFLLQSGDRQDDGAPNPVPEEPVMAAVRHLLDGYGLGGANRLDLAFALVRRIEPLLNRGRAILAGRSAFGSEPAAPARPSGSRDDAAGRTTPPTPP
jgi:hypothetical protein